MTHNGVLKKVIAYCRAVFSAIISQVIQFLELQRRFVLTLRKKNISMCVDGSQNHVKVEKQICKNESILPLCLFNLCVLINSLLQLMQ